MNPPSQGYLAASDFERERCGSHAENADAGAALGLVHLRRIASNEDDWDRHEGLQRNAAERHAYASPEDPDNEELHQRMRAARESYLRRGRDELGWALYLFLKQ